MNGAIKRHTKLLDMPFAYAHNHLKLKIIHPVTKKGKEREKKNRNGQCKQAIEAAKHVIIYESFDDVNIVSE